MLMTTAAAILRRTSGITTSCSVADIIDACAYLRDHPGTEEQALADYVELAERHYSPQQAAISAEAALLIETAIALGA